MSNRSPNSFRPLRADGKVLILGGRSSNYPGWMHTHPRIVIWYNTDPATWNKDKIPEGVDVIVHTRFVDHRLTERVNKIKPDGVRLLPIPFNTGMIKQALAAFGIQAITHPQAP